MVVRSMLALTRVFTCPLHTMQLLIILRSTVLRFQMLFMLSLHNSGVRYGALSTSLTSLEPADLE